MDQDHFIKTDIISIDRLIDTVQDLSLARELNDITKIVRKVARDLTGAQGATFVIREGEYCFYADEDAISPLWKGRRFPMEACISGWVMRNRQSVTIEDVFADDRIPDDVYRPTFVKSMAMVPIRTKAPIGAIGNYWAAFHLPTAEEVHLLQALADITAVSIDNTETHKQLEEKLEEKDQIVQQLKTQKQQLEDQKQQIQELNQIIAHNLRSPLANLQMLKDLINKSESVEEQVAYIEKQQPLIDSLQATFDEVMSAINIKSSDEIEKDEIILEDSVKNVKNLLQGDIIKSGALITCDFSQVPNIRFPKSYMDSILLNLISNAIKYRSSERNPEIHVQSKADDHHLYLEVLDNGLGLDLDKYKDKIFKLRKTFHDHPEAKGFGLFITKAQVEAMGGKIDLVSTTGVGSRFIIQLTKNN